MAIINNQNNIIYFQVSCGNLKYKKDGKKETAKAYEGKLIKIEYDDDNEFEGKKIPQYHIYMKDEANNELAIITFGEDTYFYKGFFSRIENVDLSKPFILGVIGSKENEKISFCYLKQNDTVIKANENFPNPEKIKKGKIEFNDWSNVNSAVSEILERINSKLEKIGKPVDVYPDTDTEIDLPF
jgi:hypothetical protein